MKRVVFAGRLTDEQYRAVLERDDGLVLEALPDDPDQSGSALARAHVYQITSARDDIDPRLFVSASLLAGAPNLLAVSTGGAGHDTVDVAACTRAGVLAVNQTGGNSEAVAEHALAMMLCLSKRIVEADRAMRSRPGVSRFDFKGREIFGKTLGIVGFGRIGRRLARLVRVFDMRVLACDPYVSQEVIAAEAGRKVELDELLRQADFVSVNCPLTPETRGLIGAREYGLMQRHAFFITTARGGIHDEHALAAALRAGGIAGAGLDVWEREPPPPDHPLLQLDNVLASPHTAGGTEEARVALARMAAEQVLGILAGEPPPRLLNPEAWPVFAERFARIRGFRPRAPGSARSH